MRGGTFELKRARLKIGDATVVLPGPRQLLLESVIKRGRRSKEVRPVLDLEGQPATETLERDPDVFRHFRLELGLHDQGLDTMVAAACLAHPDVALEGWAFNMVGEGPDAAHPWLYFFFPHVDFDIVLGNLLSGDQFRGEFVRVPEFLLREWPEMKPRIRTFCVIKSAAGPPMVLDDALQDRYLREVLVR